METEEVALEYAKNMSTKDEGNFNICTKFIPGNIKEGQKKAWYICCRTNQKGQKWIGAQIWDVVRQCIE